MCSATPGRERRNRRPRLPSLLVAVAAALAGCDVEEHLQLASDGSGTYRARVTVDHAFASALGRLKEQAADRGFEILEEGGDASGRSMAFGREFDRVSDLDADSATYRFEVERRSLLGSAYRLTVELREDLLESGFDRRLVVRMPAPIRFASAGVVASEVVVWECSQGGTLIVEAEGFGVSKAWWWAAAFGMLAVGTAAGAGWWFRRSRRSRL